MGLIETNVFIDFDNDIDFSGANEDISEYATKIVIQRGTDSTLNAGSLELMVNDADGRFQPQHAGGVYAGGLMLGRRVGVSMGINTDGRVWDTTTDAWGSLAETWGRPEQFYGFIEEITPEYIAAEEEDPQRGLIANDLLSLLEIRKVTTGTLLDKTTGEIVDLILDNLGWEPGLATLDRSYLDTPTCLLGGPGASWRELDDGKSTIPYCEWDKMPIASIIRDVLTAEWGHFWVGKDGKTHFEDRVHRSSDRTSVATLTDANISEMVLKYSNQELFNNVDVIAHPRSVGSAASVVFNAIGDADGHKIAAGETREYYVSYTDPETGRMCEVTDIVTPVASTDYVANANADGTGADRTTDLDVTFEADDNERYMFSVLNDSATDLYLTTLQLRATPLVAYDAVTMNAKDDLSIAQYLQRDLTVDSTLLNNPVEAQDYADWLLYLHKAPRARIERLTLVDSNLENALHIINREISDRVTIQSDDYHIDGDYFIDGISIETDIATGQTRCDWMLSSQSADVLFFTLDVDVLDGEAVLGY